MRFTLDVYSNWMQLKNDTDMKNRRAKVSNAVVCPVFR